MKLKCGEETGNALIIDNSHAITVKHCVREYFDDRECIKLYNNEGDETVFDAVINSSLETESEPIVVLSFSPPLNITEFPLLLSYIPNVFEEAATYGFNKNYSERAVWHELKCISNNVDSQSGIVQDLIFREKSSEKSVEGLSGSPIVQLENKSNVYGLMSVERLEGGSKIDIEGISFLSHIDYLKKESVLVNEIAELESQQVNTTKRNGIRGLTLNNDNHLNPYLFNADTIEFCGRHKEMSNLMGFIESDQRFSWWVLTGEAGSGKSRIAYELCSKLSGSGWNVSYFYNENNDIFKEVYKSISSFSKNLIIADNGRTYSYILGKWMLEIINNTSALVRVLIIDRNTNTDQDDILLHNLYENDLNGQLHNRIWNKTYLRLERFEDKEVSDIISSYALYRGLAIDEESMKKLVHILHVIDNDHMRPLYAMFLVDAWSEGFNLTNCKLENIIEWIINRDYTHRANVIRESVGDVRVNMRRVKAIDALLFISTYNGGVDLDTIKEKYKTYWNEAIKSIENSTTGIGLEELLISAGLLLDNTIIPIKPDILGEYYTISNFVRMKAAMFTDGWSDNENLQMFLLRTLNDYKEKIINDKPFRVPFLQEFMQGKPNTQRAIDIYCTTLIALIHFDQLEKRSDYVNKLAEIYDYNRGVQSAIYYSIGLLDLSAKQADLSSLVKTVETLREIERKYNNDEIRLCYAKALFNLSNSQELRDKYKTVKKIKQLLTKDKTNQLIAYEYAKSLYNLYGFQSTDAEMKTAEELKDLSEEYSENEDIAKEYAMFLYNIQDEGFNNEQIGSIINQLYALSLRFTDNKDIQLYIIWALRAISYNNSELFEEPINELILNIKSNLKKEDIEYIEVKGTFKFLRDENGEQLVKAINAGGKIYIDEDSIIS